MHRRVDGAVQQRLLDLLGEKALAADLRQSPVEDLVAGGLDNDDFDGLVVGQIAVGLGQTAFNFVRLSQGERAASGPEAENGGLGHKVPVANLPVTRDELSKPEPSAQEGSAPDS